MRDGGVCYAPVQECKKTQEIPLGRRGRRQVRDREGIGYFTRLEIRVRYRGECALAPIRPRREDRRGEARRGCFLDCIDPSPEGMSVTEEDVEDDRVYDERSAPNPSSSSDQHFPSVLSPRSLQIKLKISLPNLPSPSMSSPRVGRIPSQPAGSSSEKSASQTSNNMASPASTQYIREMPRIVSIYDSLAPQLKSYFLLHLLKRSPLSTLRFVQSLVTPALKRDFLNLLPPEICFRIISYLDVCSIGRCHAVRKSWYTLLSGDAAMNFLWYPRLEAEGWLPEQLISSSYRDDSLEPDCRNYYKLLYKGHYVIRQNWLHGRYKQISFPGHSFSVVTCLQFDSKRIVSGSDDQTVHIYDINTGCLMKRLRGHEGGVWALQYWDNLLVSGSTDRTIRVWDMNTGECTHLFEGHTSTVRCLMIMVPAYCHIKKKMEPDRPLIVTGSRDSTLRVWTLPLRDDSSSAPFQNRDNPDLSNTSSSAQNETATFRRFDSPNPHLLYLLQGHSNSVRAVAGKCNVLISGSYDCTVRSWDLSTGKCIFVFRGHREKVYSVDYCHYSQKAASGSMDSTVRVWCTRTGACLFHLEGHTSLVGLLEISPHFLVSAAADATLRIWSTETGKCLACLTGHSAAITCFHHDPYLNRVVSGSEGGIKVWELCSDTTYKGLLLETAKYERECISLDQPLSFPALSPQQSSSSGSLQKLSYGRFINDLVVCVQGVWRVKMSERYLVTAVQKDEGKTWFEVLDFGCGSVDTSSSASSSEQH